MRRARRTRRPGWPMIGAALAFSLLIAIAAVLLMGDPWPSAGGPAPDGTTQSPTETPSTTPRPTDPTDPADPGIADPADPGTADPSSPAPSGSSSPTPPASAAGPLDDDSAKAAVGSYLAVVAELEPEITDVSAHVDTIAGASIIEELEADLLELDSHGWQRTGAPVVLSATVVDQDVDASPPTATVQACVDSSDVQVLDAAGEPLPTDPSAARAINIYTFTQNDDESWVIASRSFPSDPSC